MKEKLRLAFKSRIVWGAIGTIAGAIYPPIGQLINLISQVALGGGF
ncbi:MAG: hypothetical protein V4605_08890 [Pseudomonadota bacterium]